MGLARKQMQRIKLKNLSSKRTTVSDQSSDKADLGTPIKEK